MARTRRWNFLPGEVRSLSVNMTDELNSGVTLTGSTPVVSAWTRTGMAGSYTYTEVTSEFTFANEQVNTSTYVDVNGETVAIGHGIMFTVTAPTTQGTYYIVTECAADNGIDDPRREDVLVVSGPGAPA